MAAIIIGLFVIFPDIARELENNEKMPEKLEQFIIPPPVQNSDHPIPDNREYNRPPNDQHFYPINLGSRKLLPKILFEFFYFFALALLLLYINNSPKSILKSSKKFAPYRLSLLIFATLLICVLAQYLYSVFRGINSHGPDFGFFNGMVLFKCFFVGIIAVLFSQLIQVLFKQQEIRLEVEKLRSENLRNRFDALAAQINPHFFFNSLNALSGLVRVKDNSNALKYINELSRIFRYVLKGNWQHLVSLQDEINFLKAYQYLLQIRYGNNLLFEIKGSPEEYQKFQLPYLSLQPLIENVIKHNIISKNHSMQINIFIKENNKLIVSNPIQPKIETEPGTGIGLSNLNNRYKLLMNQDISSFISNNMFVVELPLSSIDQENNESTNY